MERTESTKVERIASRLINRIENPLVSKISDLEGHSTLSIYNCFTGGSGLNADYPKLRVCLDVVLHYKQSNSIDVARINKEFKSSSNAGRVPMMIDNEPIENPFGDLPDSCGDALVSDTIPICVGDIIEQACPAGLTLMAIEIVEIEYGSAQLFDEGQYRFTETHSQLLNERYYNVFIEFEDVTDERMKLNVQHVIDAHSEDPRIFARFDEDGQPFAVSANSRGFYEKLEGDLEASYKSLDQVLGSVAPIDENENFKLILGESRGYFIGCFIAREKEKSLFARKVCVLFQLFMKEFSGEIGDQMATVEQAVGDMLNESPRVLFHRPRRTGSAPSTHDYDEIINNRFQSIMMSWDRRMTSTSDVVVQLLHPTLKNSQHPLVAVNLAAIKIGLVDHPASPGYASDHVFTKSKVLQPFYTHLVSTFSNLSDDDRNQFARAYSDDLKEHLSVWMSSKFPAEFHGTVLAADSPGYVPTSDNPLPFDQAIIRNINYGFAMRATSRRGFIAGCFETTFGIRICVSMQVLYRLKSEWAQVNFGGIVDPITAIRSTDFPFSHPAGESYTSRDHSLIDFLSQWPNASPKRFSELLDEYMKLCPENSAAVAINLAGIRFGPYNTGESLSSSSVAVLLDPASFQRGKITDIPGFYLRTERREE